LPSLKALGSQVNDFNQEQQLKSIQKALEFALPGGLGKAQGIVNSQLAGEIPADVQAQIQRSSAARAISGGYGGGSGLGRNLTLRDLGLTSLQQQQQGFNNFGALAESDAESATVRCDIDVLFTTTTIGIGIQGTVRPIPEELAR
jgi:hypothetical protein